MAMVHDDVFDLTGSRRAGDRRRNGNRRRYRDAACSRTAPMSPSPLARVADLERTSAAIVEATGRKCLIVPTDVKVEDQVVAMVAADRSMNSDGSTSSSTTPVARGWVPCRIYRPGRGTRYTS